MTRTASAVLAEAVNQMLSIKHILIEKLTPARRHSLFLWVNLRDPEKGVELHMECGVNKI